MKNPAVNCAFGLALALLLGACTEKTEETPLAAQPAAEPDCVLKMGWDPWEPYQYRNARGDIAGLDVEIAAAAAEDAGCEIEFVEGKWVSLLQQLREGELSLLAGATPTPGREAFATFTAPYRSESFVVYTLADNAGLGGASALEDLLEYEARLGTVAEYYYGPEITEILDRIYEAGRLREAVVAEMNYERLLNGELDAFIEDPFVASSVLRSRGLADRIVPTRIHVQAQDVTFMLSRAGVSEEVADRFSDALDAMTASGRLDEIVSRYRVASVAAR